MTVSDAEISLSWRLALQCGSIVAKVFPLKEPRDVKAPKNLKTPKHVRWQHEATTNESIILQWALRDPGAGYRIVCGHKFMALDYDDVSKSGFNAEREYIHKRLASDDTKLFVQRTGSERGFTNCMRERVEK